MPRCIYCLREKPIPEFDTEHVIPQSFGVFDNNLTLNGCVCRECNAFLGRVLDIHLARGSMEGLLRYTHGVRSPAEAGKFTYDRIVASMDSSDEWNGFRFEIRPIDRDFEVIPVPQVGLIRKSTGRWEYLLEHELRSVLTKDLSEFETLGVKIMGQNQADVERLLAAIREFMPSFEVKGDLPANPYAPGQPVATMIKYRIDSVIKRAIAKIGFNYAACMLGPARMLTDVFDDVRRYVRDGGPPTHPIVVPQDRPILALDGPLSRQTTGHLLTLDWEGHNMFAQVGLFNHANYRVNLARNVRLWSPITGGHHFNLESHKVTQMRQG